MFEPKIDDLTGDFILNETGTNFVMIQNNTERVLRDIRRVLGTPQGDWVVDDEYGTPYFQDILVRNLDLNVARERLSTVIRGIPFVLGIQEMTFDTRPDGALFVRVKILVDGGEPVLFTQTIGV